MALTDSWLGEMCRPEPWNPCWDNAAILWSLMHRVVKMQEPGDLADLRMLNASQMKLRAYSSEDHMTFNEALVAMQKCAQVNMTRWLEGVDCLRFIAEEWTDSCYNVKTPPVWEFLSKQIRHEDYGDTEFDCAAFMAKCPVQVELYEQAYKLHVYDPDVEPPSDDDPDEHARMIRYWEMKHDVKRLLHVWRSKFMWCYAVAASGSVDMSSVTP